MAAFSFSGTESRPQGLLHAYHSLTIELLLHDIKGPTLERKKAPASWVIQKVLLGKAREQI